MKRACSSLEARAPTIVFWDIDRCPVPHGVDPRRVVPCIKRFLKNLGYSGRLIITAVGILTNVPEDVLRTLSSTGIFLHHGSDYDMDVLLYGVTVDVQLPANLMVISTPSSHSRTLTFLNDNWGYNVICPLSCVPQEPSSSNSLLSKFLMADSGEDTCSEIGESSNSLWSKFLMADSEEDTCSETVESGLNVICPLSCVPQEPSSLNSLWNSFLMEDTGPPPEEEEEDKRTKKTGDWVCILCENLDGLGAESLITHLSSREHAHEVHEVLISLDGLDSMVETPRYYYPDTAVWTMDPSIMIKKEPELKEAVDMKKEKKKEPEQKGSVDLKKKEKKEKKKKSFAKFLLRSTLQKKSLWT